MEAAFSGDCQSLYRSIMRGDKAIDVQEKIDRVLPDLREQVCEAVARSLQASTLFPAKLYCCRLAEVMRQYTSNEDTLERVYDAASRAGSHAFTTYWDQRAHRESTASLSCLSWSVKVSTVFSDVPLAVWPAAFDLIDTCCALPELCPGIWAKRRLLELGAGTGLAGIVLGRGGLRLAEDALPSVLTLTDAEERSCRLMSDNLALNPPSAGHACVTDLRIDNFDWTSLTPSSARDLRAYGDVCIGSDLVYEPQAVTGLAAALAVFLEPHYCTGKFRMSPDVHDCTGKEAEIAAPIPTCAADTLHAHVEDENDTDVIVDELGRQVPLRTLLQLLQNPTAQSQAGDAAVTRWGLLATTRRNPTTYAHLISMSRAHGVAFVDLHRAWAAEGEGEWQEPAHVLDTGRKDGRTLSAQAHWQGASDGRVALLLHHDTLRGHGLRAATAVSGSRVID